MAYEAQYLTLTTAAFSKASGNVWSLRTTDAIADVNTDGYISDGKARGMKQGDLIDVFTHDALPAGSVTEVNRAFVASVSAADDSVDLTDGTAVAAADAD